MKLVLIGPALAAALVAACAANSRHATAPQRAAEEAKEEKLEAQKDAQDARRDAEKARQEAQEATRVQRDAEQNARWAAQREAQAEAQAADSPTAVRKGAAERQAENASPPRVAKRSVFFASNSADLSADAKVQLDEVATNLRDHARGYKVVIEGYSDDTGVESDNERLSARRAVAVADYLESKGVQADRMTTKGLGSRYRASEEETNRGRALNRRVEIVIEPAAGK
jgi:outer membrane protein OmpA-like peptidoglycan-associated protein